MMSKTYLENKVEVLICYVFKPILHYKIVLEIVLELIYLLHLIRIW